MITNIHNNMRRCLLLDNGTVNYYLNPTDSTKKEDGTNANLDGSDGMVMVEIPKFYTKRKKEGTITSWYISDVPTNGYTLHPAFVKDGVEVDYRYVGAYHASYWDATDGVYKSGLNLDNLSGSLDVSNDKLASVSGVYPICGVDRPQCRTLARNRGNGWCVFDFYLVQAIQMLYVVEYQTFYSQQVLGDGNVNGSYLSSSAVQEDSPHSIAGLSNVLGNRSTNGSQPSTGAKPGIAYMSYRGIENFYGNGWQWIDGWNTNNNLSSVSNYPSTFDDASLTTNNYNTLGISMPAATGYINNIQDLDNVYLPSQVGANSSSYLTDYYYQNSGLRAVTFGGQADYGPLAGAFACLRDISGRRRRDFSSRLAY